MNNPHIVLRVPQARIDPAMEQLEKDLRVMTFGLENKVNAEDVRTTFTSEKHLTTFVTYIIRHDPMVFYRVFVNPDLEPCAVMQGFETTCGETIETMLLDNDLRVAIDFFKNVMKIQEDDWWLE